MNEKRCPKCGTVKSISDFYQRKTGKRALQFYENCKKCMRSGGKNYYHLHRDRQLPLAIARRHKSFSIKSEYIGKLKDVPCMDCGVRYPLFVMDFDHREKKDKIENIARMRIRNWSMVKIKLEIEKCDIVCANCHRIRTYGKSLPR